MFCSFITRLIKISRDDNNCHQKFVNHTLKLTTIFDEKTQTYTASTVRITGRKLLHCGKCTMDLIDGALRDSKGNIKPTDSRI